MKGSRLWTGTAAAAETVAPLRFRLALQARSALWTDTRDRTAPASRAKRSWQRLMAACGVSAPITSISIHPPPEEDCAAFAVRAIDNAESELATRLINGLVRC